MLKKFGILSNMEKLLNIGKIMPSPTDVQKLLESYSVDTLEELMLIQEKVIYELKNNQYKKEVLESTIEYNISTIYNYICGDCKGLWSINNKEIDAVVVATPTSTHFDIVKECFLKGKDVFCEKPLTVTTSESEQLIELAADNNKILMVDHTFLYNNGIQVHLNVKRTYEEPCA